MYILDCPLPAVSHLQPQSTIFATQFLNVGGEIESLTFPHTTLFRNFITLHPDLKAVHEWASIAWRDLSLWENRSRHEEYRFWIAHCLRYHNSNHSQRHSMSIIQCRWQITNDALFLALLLPENQWHERLRKPFENKEPMQSGKYLKQKWPDATICPKSCGSGSQIWSKCLWTSVTFALKLAKDSFTLKYGRFNSMKWQFALRGKNEGRYVYAICPCWCWLSYPSNFAHNVHRIAKLIFIYEPIFYQINNGHSAS